MIQKMISRVLIGAAVVGAAGLVSACSSDSHGRESEPIATGTLSMPLSATAGEHTYRLEGGLMLNGPLFTYLDLGGDTEVVTTSLPTGAYSANLYYWNLTRDDGEGNFLPVAATLRSSSYTYFSIFNLATTSLSFEFETDGQPVTIGAGSLSVDIQVHETPALCSLLGSDCPSGTWCAPPELTGETLRCIEEGPVELGAACSSPLDCTANTSCFDFGGGPICAALCGSADFDQPCSSGGTCSAQGTDYGVCIMLP